MDKDDLFLYQEIQKGNKVAFNELFKKYYVLLCKFSFVFLKDKDSSQEIAQDIFVSLWNDAPVRKIDNVKSYLFTMAKNRSLNEIASVKRKNEILENHKDDIYIQDSNENDHSYFKKMLQSNIELLPDKCKQIFQLTKIEGLTYDEVAEYLQVSKKTVENQMGIALKKLRENLKPHIDKFFLIIIHLFLGGMHF